MSVVLFDCSRMIGCQSASGIIPLNRRNSAFSSVVRAVRPPKRSLSVVFPPRTPIFPVVQGCELCLTAFLEITRDRAAINNLHRPCTPKSAPLFSEGFFTVSSSQNTGSATGRQIERAIFITNVRVALRSKCAESALVCCKPTRARRVYRAGYLSPRRGGSTPPRALRRVLPRFIGTFAASVFGPP